MSLHDRIISLEPRGQTSSASKIHFNDARLRAAQIAKEADELMAEMANTLCGLDPDQLTLDQQDNLSRVLVKYNDYKEQAK